MSTAAKDAVPMEGQGQAQSTDGLLLTRTTHLIRDTPIHLVRLNCLSHINKRSLALRAIDQKKRERKIYICKLHLKHYYVTPRARKTRARSGSSSVAILEKILT